jgi:hypothetical protein
MSKKNTVEKPKFTPALLHPKYWGVWFGFGLLALTVNLLPYALLLKIGRGIGALGMKLGKSRVKIAKRNLELAFPEMEAKEVDHMVVENFKNTGMALIETGITWFWPTWRFKRILIAKDIKELQRLNDEGKGVLLCCVHALNLEITARAFGVLGLPGYGAYRPHTNPAYEFIQYRGRTRNGNQLIYRRDLKQMVRVCAKAIACSTYQIRTTAIINLCSCLSLLSKKLVQRQEPASLLTLVRVPSYRVLDSVTKTANTKSLPTSLSTKIFRKKMKRRPLPT